MWRSLDSWNTKEELCDAILSIAVQPDPIIRCCLVTQTTEATTLFHGFLSSNTCCIIHYIILLCISVVSYTLLFLLSWTTCNAIATARTRTGPRNTTACHCMLNLSWFKTPVRSHWMTALIIVCMTSLQYCQATSWLKKYCVVKALCKFYLLLKFPDIGSGEMANGTLKRDPAIKSLCLSAIFQHRWTQKV